MPALSSLFLASAKAASVATAAVHDLYWNITYATANPDQVHNKTQAIGVNGTWPKATVLGPPSLANLLLSPLCVLIMGSSLSILRSKELLSVDEEVKDSGRAASFLNVPMIGKGI
ncbi:hypothetical protein I312_102257 [Cryptococcus bacillisporus CA1280]|uniref:uncharacterized protein n=1 Tax=Cryptococcus bacillisporus CA1280 TaxID=1296109 RepID=UPI0033689C65